jgi:hypothetical protein
MANLDRPCGLKPLKYLNGTPWNGKVTMYYKPAALNEAIFIGSPVKLAGSADATGKYPSIALAAANVPILGAVVGFGSTPNIIADFDDLDLKYSPASTEHYVAVADDPSIIFECQEDSSTTFTVDEIGNNASLTAESGNTTTGKSTVEIDCSTEATTSTLGVRILRLIDRVDNELGDYAKYEVLINAHAYGQGLGATGV